MAKGLQIAEPPPRRPAAAEVPEAPPPVGEKFSQVRASDRVQFNKRVPQSVADGFRDAGHQDTPSSAGIAGRSA